MNSGTISRRYATALLKYVQQTGNGEKVAAQVRSLIGGGTDDVTLEPELERFCALLLKNGRMCDVKQIFQSFIDLWYESIHMIRVRLHSAIKSEDMEKRVSKLIEAASGLSVELTSDTDPSLIGGFIIESDEFSLDASVRRQLDDIRRELRNDNKRIV